MPQASAQVVAAAPVQTSASAPFADEQKWKQAGVLPCDVSVQVPVHGFTLKDLLALRATSVVSTQRATTANLPLRINGELIAWCEFEVMGSRLSVRLTELP